MAVENLLFVGAILSVSLGSLAIRFVRRNEKLAWNKKETLSKNEKISLLNAIKANTPKEYEQLAHVVKQSEEKEITPTEIEVYLMEKRSLTPTQASLERTGLMARLQDLGLIQKK